MAPKVLNDAEDIARKSFVYTKRVCVMQFFALRRDAGSSRIYSEQCGKRNGDFRSQNR